MSYSKFCSVVVCLKSALFSHSFFLSHSLQEMSSTLAAIRETEGKGLDELEKQLQTSREIFDSMQDNLMGNILQNLISVVLNCDKDGDMTLSDEEIDMIILKLEGMNGVDLKEDLLREALIQNGRSLNGACGKTII